MTRRQNGVPSAVAVGLAVAFLVAAVSAVRDEEVGDVDGRERFGVMIDAGSSGSRVYVFTWKNGDLHTLEDITLTMGYTVGDNEVEPGISSLSPAEATASLDPLLDLARTVVPASERAEAVLFLRATAGVRLMGESARGSLMRAVGDYLAASGFYHERWFTQVMSGAEEGVCGWIAVNYLRGAFGSSANPEWDPTKTVGSLDLGGASLEITFLPFVADLPESRTTPGIGLQRLFGRTFKTFSHSFLRYGINEAYAVAQEDEEAMIACHGVSASSASCSAAVAALFFGEGTEFASVAVPSLTGHSFVGHDKFFKNLQGADATTMSADEIVAHAARLCDDADLAATLDPSTADRACFDATYIAAIVGETGFALGGEQFEVVERVEGRKVSWALGAMLLDIGAHGHYVYHTASANRKFVWVVAVLFIGGSFAWGVSQMLQPTLSVPEKKEW